jgi:hypothetical protein
MTTRSKAFTVGVIVLVVGLGVVVTKLSRRAHLLADHSAHAALTAEISEQLEAIPKGQSYPAALSELRLTFPDGGDSSLLTRFTYQSAGTNCTFRTRLGDRDILRSFP